MMHAATHTTSPLLVELFTEELPPRALRALGEAFGYGIAEGLKSCGLVASEPPAEPEAEAEVVVAVVVAEGVEEGEVAAHEGMGGTCLRR